ncbi:MAG: PHP domain-containing protein [Bryobacteraceae bacterium]|nr:PHP domain-containing protein [Bryobacteraceae bacterium]
MIDLHTHSSLSDGTDSPAALVRLAAQLGLEALALTDHDTLAGVDEAAAESDRCGLEFIRGIEISARRADEPDELRRTVHVLGYFFQPPHDGFSAWLESLHGRRRARNQAMARRLQALGYDVRLEEAEALARHVTARPHFAEVLVRKGYFPSVRAAIDALLAEGAPAYVEKEDPSPEECIARIRAAGGVASLAHPRRLNQQDPAAEERILRRLVDAGLAAIEVWHPDHDQRAASRYFQLARKYGLAVTGGSDYHGLRTPDLRPGDAGGARVRLSVLHELRRRAGH